MDRLKNAKVVKQCDTFEVKPGGNHAIQLRILHPTSRIAVKNVEDNEFALIIGDCDSSTYEMRGYKSENGVYDIATAIHKTEWLDIHHKFVTGCSSEAYYLSTKQRNTTLDMSYINCIYLYFNYPLDSKQTYTVEHTYFQVITEDGTPMIQAA